MDQGQVRTRPRALRRRALALLVTLLTGTLLAVIPASPASASQLISWNPAPPASAQMGQAMSFRWDGTANTTFGARITGCFADFADGQHYSYGFGGSYQTGYCNYTKVANILGNYHMQVGFYLSTGGTMSQTWNVTVSAPTPTVVTTGNQTVSATSVNGAPASYSAYGTDNWYGTYAGTCSPASGTVLPVGTNTVTCSSTSPGGKIGTATLQVTVAKSNPVINWALPSSVPGGTTYGSLKTAAMASPDATGTIVYRDANGNSFVDTAQLPVGNGQVISATYVPTGAALIAYNQVTTARTIDVYQVSQAVVFTDAPTNETFGDAPFPVTAAGTTGGGNVTITAQSGSRCTVNQSGSGTNVNAVVTITGAGACVLLANQAASGQFTAAPTAFQSVTVAKKTPVVTWTAQPGLAFPTSLGAGIVAANNSGVPGTYSYLLDGDPFSGSFAPNAGDHQLVVIFTPDDLANHTAGYLFGPLVVEQGTPVLTVPTLTDVVYGDEELVPFAPTTTGDGPVTRTSLTTTVCAVGPTSITILGAGTCTISTSQAETGNYQAVAATTQSFTIAKGTPALSWADPEIITYGTPLGAAQLNAVVTTPSNALGEYAYTVNGDDAEGAVLDAGIRTIHVTWTPFTGFADNWDAVEADVTIPVDRAMPPIEWATPADLTYGTPLGADQLNASIPGDDTAFTYSALGEAAEGAILPAGDQYIIVEFQPSNPNYLSGTLGVPIHVNQAPQAISFSVSGNHTYQDDPFGLTALGGGSVEPVLFGAEGACTVAGRFVTITGAGPCDITASQGGNDNYLAAPSVTRSVTIDKATPRLSWAKPTAITYGTPLGAAQLDATVAQTGATGQAHYYLSDGVTPADGAVLHAGDDQTLVVIFVPDAQGSANYVPATATVRIDVAKAAQAITFPQPGNTTYGAADLTVGATGGGSGLPVTFTSTGDGCAVNGTTVQVLVAGSCTITAAQAGNDDFLPATSVERTIVVAKAPQAIVLGEIAHHTYGDAPFAVDVTPGPATAPAFVSADGACAILGTTVTITGAGSCTVTVVQGGDDNHLGAAPVTRTFAIAKAGQALAFASLGTVNFADGSVEAQASGGPSGQPVTFTATGVACDVVGTTVFVRHAGSCDVTASQAGDGNFLAAADVTSTLTVTPQVLGSTWSPAGLTYGDPIGAAQRNATVNPDVPGTWSYSVAEGTVLGAGTHQLEATFTPDATGDILPVTLTVPVVVDRANQTITFGEVEDHTFGDDPFGVTAAGGASGQPVTFSSATDACATTDRTVTIVAAGGCTIAADQAGDTNFNAAPTVTRSFGVDKAMPTIEWAPPGAITFGTPLGEGQLSAVATFGAQAVAGTFTYGPAAGAVLHASATPQVLTVTFTPANQRDFTPASGTTTMVVARAPQAITLPIVPDTTYGQGPVVVPATGGASGQPVSFATAGSCSVVGALVTISGAGACTVTADQGGNADFLAAAPVSATFAIAKAAGSVELPSIADRTYGDAPFTITALRGPSTGAVTLSTTGTCAVSSTGQVSINGAGPCSVVAVHDGDDNHLVAEATRTFAIAKAAQTLTFEPLADRRYGDAAFALTATPGASGQPVTFTATGAACTVAGSTVTVLAAGSCTITAGQAGTDDHLAATPVVRTLTVNPGTLTITTTSASRSFGLANPTFAFTVTGYVSGDTATAITTPPTCTTTATTTSPTGTYPISCSGAASATYTFTYKAGTLTVGKVATRLTITNPAILPAGATTVSATLTDALTGAPIQGEPIVLAADFSIKQATSSPATASFSLKSGVHVLGALYLGDANHWPAIDAQLLTSYEQTKFVIWGGNTGGLQVGKDYTYYGSQWSKQVKQGTNGAGSSFKGYASTVNAAGTAWTSTTSANPSGSVGDVISVLVTTSTAKSGNNLSGNVTKQVLLLVDDADGFRSNGNQEIGELLTSL